VFPLNGKVEVNVKYERRTSQEELLVVTEEYDALLRRIWIRHLGISLQEIDSERLVNSSASGVHKVDCIDGIISRYPEIFEETVIFQESKRHYAFATKLNQSSIKNEKCHMTSVIKSIKH
jgi:hypothetical protein